jgi:putative solute:sodium symporter small subunit
MSDPPNPPARGRPEATASERAYWRHNVRYVALLLVVWFAVSYGAGILLVEPLNAVRIPGTGFPLGFWFAQQGSIYVFVVLIFVYVGLMNRLDRRYELDELDELDEFREPDGEGAAP